VVDLSRYDAAMKPITGLAAVGTLIIFAGAVLLLIALAVMFSDEGSGLAVIGLLVVILGQLVRVEGAIRDASRTKRDDG
jgi:hypothetical protein